MKRCILSLVVLSATALSGLGQTAQSGTPAQIEVTNGKSVKGFLQSLENGVLTFQPPKSDRDYPAPADKIATLTFYPKYDSFATEESFNAGEYSAVISTLDPVMKPYWDYMSISNNLLAPFGMLVKAHFVNEDFDRVQSAADILMESRHSELLLQGQVYSALVALSNTDTNGIVTTNGLAVAEKFRNEVESDAAGLYLQACIERAQGEPRTAIWTLCGVIANYGNDLEWMPPSELLAAHLYLDDGMTNSAANTARQVQSIYGGSSVASDAQTLKDALPVKEPPVEETPAAEEVQEPETAQEVEKPEEEMAIEQDAGQDEM